VISSTWQACLICGSCTATCGYREGPTCPEPSTVAYHSHGEQLVYGPAPFSVTVYGTAYALPPARPEEAARLRRQGLQRVT